MHEYIKKLVEVRFGILFALLTLIYGFGLGGVFGGFEDGIKGHLKAKAQNVLDTKYNNDETKMKQVTDKSWVYFKRAHLHANGLGTSALALIFLLSFLPVASRLKSIIALGVGIGSLGYAMFWMFAGLRAPGMGSTGAAKESLQWLSIPSSGLCIFGLIAVSVLAVNCLFRKGTNGPDAQSSS
ncbi:MAG: hypothetical protein O7E52_12620 [Candidatus Poribacteria bacterium]|nr:hypothetical protein [Candidatus Poribacteria bacterium]